MSGRRVRLSVCRTWRTEDGGPFGTVTAVRCPSRDTCLQLVPVMEGRQLGGHARNDSLACGYVGAELVDDRAELAGAEHMAGPAGLFSLLPQGAATRGRPFPAAPVVAGR